MNLGLLYFFAMGGLGVVGLMMAGWSSFNKYSLLGGLRAAAAIISYEIPLTLSVVGVIMLTGTLSLNSIVERQSGSFLDWFVFQQPLAFLIFFIAATAEGSRTPFDFTEADSEIVAGFATEYSGMRFGFFFFAEYVNVFILSALTVRRVPGRLERTDQHRSDPAVLQHRHPGDHRARSRIAGPGPALGSADRPGRDRAGLHAAAVDVPFGLVVPEVAGRRASSSSTC